MHTIAIPELPDGLRYRNIIITNAWLGVSVSWIYRNILWPRGWNLRRQVVEMGPGARRMGARRVVGGRRFWVISPPL